MKLTQNAAERLYWNFQRIRGRRSLRERLLWLLETQYFSTADLRELQAAKLRAVVEHAYNTVPYYRRTMEDRGVRPHDIASVSDLRKLPLLTRPLLRQNQSELVSSRADHSSLKINYSSGSTGVRAQFQQDASFRLWMRAHQLRTYGWCGNWRVGEPFVLLWGSEIYWSAKQFVDRFENWLSNRREFNTFQLSPALIQTFLQALITFRPALVSTYSNAMHLIAMEAGRRQVQIPGLRAIQGTSEPMPPGMRDRIGQALGCEVYDKYGSRETNIVAHESPRHDGMCIQVENVVVEILREDDSPCRAGEAGRVVLTTLNNLSMPLIRYETTDLAASLEGVCSSGINLPRMTSVKGRLQDLIVTPTGVCIDAYFFSYLFMRMEEVHWFQVVQVKEDFLLLRLLAPAGLTHTARAALVDSIRHHTGFAFGIEFELLAEMPRSATGKFRLCVSELGSRRAGVTQGSLDGHSGLPTS